jgi:hypothetical protein
MLQASDFVMILAQATIFTPGLNLHTTRVLSRLLGRYADVFDGDPITVPVPEGFPLAAEACRFLLQSRDQKLRLQAASSRLDLVLLGDNLDATRPLPHFLDWCLHLFIDYLDVTQGRVARLASVVHRKASPSEPAKEIASHFCKRSLLDGPLNRPSDFEIHAAKQFDLLERLRVNSWFRCKTGILLGTQRQTVVLVEQDFNTLPEDLERREFSAEERQQFFGRVPEGFRQVLDLYFSQRRESDA